MTFLEWTLLLILFTLYVSLVVTVAYLTFLKGYWILGILGIFFPILWLVGALLPPRAGSRYEAQEAMRYGARADRMTR